MSNFWTIMKQINPNITDELIEKYYKDTGEALDAIRQKRTGWI